MENSFQQWSKYYATHYGFAVELVGNWVALHKADERYECMSVGGVLDVCREHGVAA